MELSELVFSDIEEKDCKRLAELDKECFSEPWSEQLFLNDTQNPLAHYVVAHIGGEAVGYCGMYCIAGEGQITNVAVAGKYRRNGIAAKMLGMMIDKAKNLGLTVMSLEVRENNAPAVSLYENFGFMRVGYRKNYYKDPAEGAVLMDLVLTYG